MSRLDRLRFAFALLTAFAGTARWAAWAVRARGGSCVEDGEVDWTEGGRWTC